MTDRRGSRRAAAAVAAGLAMIASGCAEVSSERSPQPSLTPSFPIGSAESGPSPTAAEDPDDAEEPEAAEDPKDPEDIEAAAAVAESPEPAARPSSGRPRDALLSIPRLGLKSLQVTAYQGWTDDAAGTAIQNDGVAASPHGPRGGAGAGGVGNYQVTAHRLSAGGAFRDLPDLQRGDRVRVAAGGATYVYEVRRTRITSFRSAQSLREQRAAVPGRPGATPTRAMITLSTCRTLEDHAEGNYWSDEFDNPENRIDKIGVLVRTIERS